MKDLKILTGCVAVLTVIAVGVVLQAAQNVFLPLVIAWIISYIMAPGVRFMTRLKVPVEITTFLLLALLLYITSGAGRCVPISSRCRGRSSRSCPKR